MELLPKNHLRKRGLFSYVISIKALAGIYVPFVDVTDAAKNSPVDVPMLPQSALTDRVSRILVA